jgi:diaminopimelate epimerase
MKEFYKYEGTGNDFIMIDNRDGSFDAKNTEYIKRLCDRHFGIGADGLILLESSDKADCFMNYFNADGTIAEMCGNGVRCTAKFFQDLTDSKEISVETRSGIKKLKVHKDGTFSVNMGAPLFSHPDFPNKSLVLENVQFDFVSMGNPHAVGIVQDVSSVDISHIGPKIERDPLFRNKINIELAEKITDDYYKVKVWERGSGATLACGTGACAVYAVLKKENNNKKEITLEFPGGKLYLSQNREKEIVLRGAAVLVFKGEIK